MALTMVSCPCPPAFQQAFPPAQVNSGKRKLWLSAYAIAVNGLTSDPAGIGCSCSLHPLPTMAPVRIFSSK